MVAGRCRLFEEYPGLDALLGETVCEREFMSYCVVCVKEMQTGNNSSSTPYHVVEACSPGCSLASSLEVIENSKAYLPKGE